MSEFFQGLFPVVTTWEVATAIFDILVVYYILYRALLFIRGTRAVQVLSGLVLVFLFFVLSKEEYLNLSTLNWLLDKFISSFILIIIVIFQDDFRRALAQVGRNPIISSSGSAKSSAMIEEIVQACKSLSQKKIGAIIVVEREGDLREFIEEGIRVNADVTKEILISIFLPFYGNTLHDGAVIIKDGRVSAASCFLPLTQVGGLDSSLGTRHRAAIGLSELNDAFILVVSEETGTISKVISGVMTRGLDPNELRMDLQEVFGDTEAEEKRFFLAEWWRRFRGGRTLEEPRRDLDHDHELVSEEIVYTHESPAPVTEETVDSSTTPGTDPPDDTDAEGPDGDEGPGGDDDPERTGEGR